MSRYPTADRVAWYLSGWPRRGAALLCLLIAALSLVSGRSSRRPSSPVVIAGRAVAAGSVLQAADLQVIRWPQGVPTPPAAGSPSQLLGRRTAMTLARGTPIGNDALIETSIAQALAAGRAAVTVRLANPDALALINTGSHVDLYLDDSDSSVLVDGKPTESTPDAGPLARSVRVLSVLVDKTAESGNAHPTLVIAVDKVTAEKLSAHVSSTFVATLVEPP